MTQKDNLEQILELLEQLYTDEGRATVINVLVDRGYATHRAKEIGSKIPKSILERTIKTYLKKKEYLTAANFAENAGMKKRAKELYVLTMEDYIQKGLVEEAAKIATHVGMQKKAVEIYERASMFSQAAYAASTSGMIDRAIDNYIKSDELESAARVAQTAGMKKKAEKLYSQALKNYEEKEEYWKAARVALEMGLTDKALKYFINGKNFLEAARIIMRTKGITPEAQYYMSTEIASCEKRRDFYSASISAKTIGMKERSEVYKQIDRLFNELIK